MQAGQGHHAPAQGDQQREPGASLGMQDLIAALEVVAPTGVHQENTASERTHQEDGPHAAQSSDTRTPERDPGAAAKRDIGTARAAAYQLFAQASQDKQLLKDAQAQPPSFNASRPSVMHARSPAAAPPPPVQQGPVPPTLPSTSCSTSSSEDLAPRAPLMPPPSHRVSPETRQAPTLPRQGDAQVGANDCIQYGVVGRCEVKHALVQVSARTPMRVCLRFLVVFSRSEVSAFFSWTPTACSASTTLDLQLPQAVVKRSQAYMHTCTHTHTQRTKCT